MFAEDDRRRVARELHDDIGQRLALLADEADCLRRDLKLVDEENRHRLDNLVDHARHLAEDLRRISHILHPAILEDLGLKAALSSLIHDFSEATGLPARFFYSEIAEELPLAVSTALYRITQEGLHNVAKHAGDASVTVSLNQIEECISLVIADNGAGFAPNQEPGLGLISMRERANLLGGTVQITSAPAKGATITVRLPIQVATKPFSIA